jgi:hypothetical protein
VFVLVKFVMDVGMHVDHRLMFVFVLVPLCVRCNHTPKPINTPEISNAGVTGSGSTMNAITDPMKGAVE